MTWTLERSSHDFKLDMPKTVWSLVCSKVSAICNGPFVDLALFNREGKAGAKKNNLGVEIAILWQNYLRSTSLRETSGWILLSLAIVFLTEVVIAVHFSDQQPSFPHRGQLVEWLNWFLVIANALILWVVIFWVIYQSRACAQFIKIMNKGDPKLPNKLLDYKNWPWELLNKTEAAIGVPREYLADYLGFELVRRATQRIRWLIYLPFVSILFVIVARSDLIDAMNFPPSLVFVIGLALTFALSSEVVLHRCAMKARIRVIARYEAQLMRMLAMPNDNPKGSSLSGMTSEERAASTQLKNSSAFTVERPISMEQIKLLVERIRNTHEGVFAPIYEQPALRALLLPFGGFGGAQLIEYFISLKV